jgi:hypothetical protein
MSGLSALVHTAKYLDSDPMYLKTTGRSYFIVVTNLDHEDRVLTHVWAEGGKDGKIHVLDGLPVRLRPDEQWISSIQEDHLKDVDDPFTAFRAFTSRQETWSSSRNDLIPPKGTA